MRYGFYNTVVHAESRLNKLFSVACDSGAAYPNSVAALLVYLRKLSSYYFNGVAAVGVVVCIEYLRVFAYQRELCGSASAVDSEVRPSAVALEV